MSCVLFITDQGKLIQLGSLNWIGMGLLNNKAYNINLVIIGKVVLLKICSF